jgi:NTP pyrophosphatase (non-canonical NTP hydrolase)
MSWNDTTCTLKMIQEQLQQFNAQRNWGQYHNPRNLAMALNVEAGELMELFLWCRDEGPQPAVESRKLKVQEEAADVLICLLNFCAQSDIDLAASVEQKIKKNALKYPVEKVFGRMEKHDEY